jgi:hypothetical protein
MFTARHFALALILMPIALPLALNAQTQAASAATDTLVGTWLVTVAGEPVTRTLVISEVAQTEGGALLSAKYGLSTGKPGPIEARLAKSGDKRLLLLTTQAASVISAMEQPDGTYLGTFTLKNGIVKEVSIAKPGIHTQAALASSRSPLASVPLAAETDPACGAFHGSWSGIWAQGGVGEVVLKVIEATSISQRCTLRITYGTSKSPITVETSGETLTFVCNRTTNGTCQFKRVGGDLWASYSNPGGGTNSAVFKKIPTP